MRSAAARLRLHAAQFGPAGPVSASSRAASPRPRYCARRPSQLQCRAGSSIDGSTSSSSSKPGAVDACNRRRCCCVAASRVRQFCASISPFVQLRGGARASSTICCSTRACVAVPKALCALRPPRQSYDRLDHPTSQAAQVRAPAGVRHRDAGAGGSRGGRRRHPAAGPPLPRGQAQVRVPHGAGGRRQEVRYFITTSGLRACMAAPRGCAVTVCWRRLSWHRCLFTCCEPLPIGSGADYVAERCVVLNHPAVVCSSVVQTDSCPNAGGTATVLLPCRRTTSARHSVSSWSSRPRGCVRTWRHCRQCCPGWRATQCWAPPCGQCCRLA